MYFIYALQVFLLPGHPVPPIAINWHKYCYACARGWEDAYASRVQHFRQVVDSSVSTIEIIDLADDNEPHNSVW